MGKSSNLSMQDRHHKLSIDVNTCCWGWSIAKPNSRPPNKRSEGDGSTVYNNRGPIRSIIDTFDLIVHLKETIDSKVNGFLLDHLLDKAMLPKKQQHKPSKFCLSFDELKEVGTCRV